MNYRRKLIVALGAGALTAPFGSFAQQQGKVWRVAVLATTTQAKFKMAEETLVGAMRELGWVEGRNVTYDRVYADDDESRLPALAAALVARGPDLIYSGSNPVTLAAFAKTRAIPIVFSASNDPVETGMVQSLARPGGNVTGISNIGWELGGKRLQMLKKALPKLNRVGVLVNPTRPECLREQALIEQAGTTLGIKVLPALMQEPKELGGAFALLAKNRVEAVLTTHYVLFMAQRKGILTLAQAQRIPVAGHRSEMANDGALMSYSALHTDQIRRAAQLADKILKGAKPADIPVEQPTKFELVVNMKTAKMLGITIPGEIMLQADRVIE